MPLDRPIPAFYCCYLLRSTVRRSSVYVGSTPNPVRRLGQHNGHAKGGANRTARPSLRPWEMACIVTGFPSQIAALQFEWAWQNSHITQHIPAESRLHRSSPRKKNGQPRRPRHGVPSLLSNLHLLLRVPSFSRWPLEIRFFSEDVYKAWQEWTKAVAEPLRSSIPITKDFPPAGSPIADETTTEAGPQAKKRKLDYGIDALELGYADHKAHVQKGKEIVEFEREGTCTICKEDLEHDAGIYAVCPNAECDSVTHLTCLGNHLIEDADSLIPIKGTCPSCETELRWVDVVKEATLRLRGQKEVEKLLKVKRARKGAGATTATETFDDDEDEELSEEDVQREIEEHLQMLDKFDPRGVTADNDEIWLDIDDSDDSDTRSIASTAAASRASKARVIPPVKAASKAGTLRTVVEDSDWDDAIVVD